MFKGTVHVILSGILIVQMAFPIHNNTFKYLTVYWWKRTSCVYFCREWRVSSVIFDQSVIKRAYFAYSPFKYCLNYFKIGGIHDVTAISPLTKETLNYIFQNNSLHDYISIFLFSGPHSYFLLPFPASFTTYFPSFTWLVFVPFSAYFLCFLFLLFPFPPALLSSVSFLLLRENCF